MLRFLVGSVLILNLAFCLFFWVLLRLDQLSTPILPHCCGISGVYSVKIVGTNSVTNSLLFVKSSYLMFNSFSWLIIKLWYSVSNIYCVCLNTFLRIMLLLLTTLLIFTVCLNTESIFVCEFTDKVLVFVFKL